MVLGRVLHAAGWALILQPWLAAPLLAGCPRQGAQVGTPEPAPPLTGLGVRQARGEGVEWLVRPLELGRSVPIASVQTTDGGELHAGVLQGLRLSAVALPEGVEVAALSATLSWPGGGMGGSSVLGASAFVLPAGAVDPAPSQINMVLHARLETAQGGAELELEGPVQWRLEFGSEETGRLDMLSDAASRVAVPLHVPSASTVGGGADPKVAPSASAPRGGGKLRAAAFAGGRRGDEFTMLAVLPRTGADAEPGTAGPARVARSVDGGRSWDIGPLRIAEREEPWRVPIEGPALLFDGRTATFRLLCRTALGESGAEGPGLVVLSSADGGRSWAAPVPMDVPRSGVDAGGKAHDLSGLAVAPSGGRGLAASSGEWLWPLEVVGPGVAQKRYVLLREARRGGTTLTTLGPRGLWAASFAELGDGAILASAASLRQASRELRLWREIDGAWRVPLRPPEPSLPCADGAAALMHVGRELFGAMDGRLVSANAAVRRKPPLRMSVRGSNDGGQRWPTDREVLLDDGKAVGGPGLAMADADSVGVVYRSSSGSVVFQSVPIGELVDPVAGVGSVTGGR